MLPDVMMLSLTCLHPPVPEEDLPCEFGLEDREGLLLAGAIGDDGALTFDFTLRAKPDEEGGVILTGPYARGSPERRFLYLTLKVQRGESWEILRRLKVPLWPIRWEQAQAALNHGEALRAAVSGEGAATVALLGDGWTLD